MLRNAFQFLERAGVQGLKIILWLNFKVWASFSFWDHCNHDVWTWMNVVWTCLTKKAFIKHILSLATTQHNNYSTHKLFEQLIIHFTLSRFSFIFHLSCRGEWHFSLFICAIYNNFDLKILFMLHFHKVLIVTSHFVL